MRMGLVKAKPPVCSAKKDCVEWVRLYLSYCLCNSKDGASLALGLVSVVSWGIAEVPQIITNYKAKSTEGLSVLFLMTWIIGDLFNLIGCMLEPATLPTQFYMALLYTITTVILTAQTIYYGHIYAGLKARKSALSCKLHEEEAVTREEQIDPTSGMEFKATNYQDSRFSAANEQLHLPSSPIPVAVPPAHRHGSGGKDLYYMSARSLSSSPNPTVGSWLANPRNSGRSPTVIPEQHSLREPLINRLVPAQSAPPSNTKNMLCVASSVILLLGCVNLHLSNSGRRSASPHGVIMFVGRKLLQAKTVKSSMIQEGSCSGIGTVLGWLMAAIYMGGRLPQICLNIQRGDVEGLNPLMFFFALIGNATYVGSILVNSLEWSKIKPNLPWLVDAGGCVLLDTCILIQFGYFHYWKRKDSESSYDDQAHCKGTDKFH